MDNLASIEPSARTITVVDEYEIDRDSSVDLEWIEGWIGRIVDARYRVTSHIGSGGMGHVFMAEHIGLGAKAAIKVLTPHSNTLAHEQFAREAQLLGRMNHPNIVHVEDSGITPEGDCYIVMEAVTGETLETWLDNNRCMSKTRALSVLRQLASAVDHLHAQGCVHRDIKPSNVMFDVLANDAVKLIDFGISCDASDAAEPSTNGLIVGTPGYMAPEQACGEPCSASSDLYAFGALALELLTGQPPFPQKTPRALVAAVLLDRPSSPSERGLAMNGLDGVFERALSREPAERFASASELVAVLTRVVTENETQAFGRLRLALPANAVSEPEETAAMSESVDSEEPHALPVSGMRAMRGLFACACAAAVWLAA